jgi:hypothetical protein
MQWDYPDWRSLAIYRSALKINRPNPVTSFISSRRRFTSSANVPSAQIPVAVVFHVSYHLKNLVD